MSTAPSSGTLLADGAYFKRHFSANEFEWYVQDAWHATPNLMLTFGVRHTISADSLGDKRTASGSDHRHRCLVQGARVCRLSRARFTSPMFNSRLAGHYFNAPGFWPKSKDNFAPRFAVAYSPDGKTSIRAGAGIYYDHYGEALINTFYQNGSFGISSSVTDPAGIYGIEGDANHTPSPRFIDCTLPPINNGGSPATRFIHLPRRSTISPLRGVWITTSRLRIRNPLMRRCSANSQGDLRWRHRMWGVWAAI